MSRTSSVPLSSKSIPTMGESSTWPITILTSDMHSFLGEESYSAGESRTYIVDDRPTWIVDPLDGTVNFTHLFPMFCVSIAFAINGVPIIGVINAPFIHQTFSSCKGRGAFFNETQRLPLIRNPIPPMPNNAPSGCTFSCEWGKDRRDIPDGNMMRKIESFTNMALEPSARGGKGGMVHGVRSLGRYVTPPTHLDLADSSPQCNPRSRIHRDGVLRYMVGRWMLGMVYCTIADVSSPH